MIDLLTLLIWVIYEPYLFSVYS